MPGQRVEDSTMQVVSNEIERIDAPPASDPPALTRVTRDEIMAARPQGRSFVVVGVAAVAMAIGSGSVLLAHRHVQTRAASVTEQAPAETTKTPAQPEPEPEPMAACAPAHAVTEPAHAQLASSKRPAAQPAKAVKASRIAAPRTAPKTQRPAARR